jgi:hypothetical protein
MLLLLGVQQQCLMVVLHAHNCQMPGLSGAGLGYLQAAEQQQQASLPGCDRMSLLRVRLQQSASSCRQILRIYARVGSASAVRPQQRWIQLLLLLLLLLVVVVVMLLLLLVLRQRGLLITASSHRPSARDKQPQQQQRQQLERWTLMRLRLHK